VSLRLLIVIASRRRGNPLKSKTQKSKGKMMNEGLCFLSLIFEFVQDLGLLRRYRSSQ